MNVSIIIPVYNEAGTIREIIKRVISTPVSKEIIVVDDGSTDGTREFLKKVNKKGVRIVYHPKNMGKGAAIRTGLEYAAGDYVLIQDADLEYDPDDYKILLEPVRKGKAEVVYGSRFIGGHRNMFFWHWTGNQFLNLLTNIFFNTTISDMETGYKVFRLDIIKSIKWKANRFDFEPEITARILKKGIRIYEVPISYAGRDYSEGKKITFVDGVIALWTLIKYRLVD